jgi:tRNA(Ile)-lysidine synthase
LTAARTGATGAVASAVSESLAAYARDGARVAVALSGGIDSMVLLDALTPFVAAHPIALSAIHVHHGLSPHADAWAKFCAEQCAAREVPLTVHRLEAVARAARYERLRSADVDVVALAHHADDQVETVLLQLLRGAGPRGLAAMPAYRPGHPALLRPLLSLPRDSLAEYARERGLAWIDDESNADAKYKRNLLRHDIVPRLAAHFPGYRGTIARAAAHQASVSAMLDDLAAADGADAVDDAGLDRAALASLANARAANLLRWFLRGEGLRAPSQARLGEILRQIVSAASDAHTRIAHDGVEIGCYRGRVIVHRATVDPFRVSWSGEASVRLPGGVLAFERAVGVGIAAARIADAAVTLRSRDGGERICLDANRPRRSVKKLLQEAGLPVWERRALPLVWCGENLVAVPGIGIELSFRAAQGETGWRIAWRPWH